MNIKISNKILDDFQLINHEYLFETTSYDELSGNQEYRLYSYLSTFFNDAIFLDIGTMNGRSAIALSYNESNKVISYDIVDNIKDPSHKVYTKNNITFHIKDVLEDLTEELVKQVKIVMIDIDHYETVETKIINRLKELNFSGMIILDDITNHPNMHIKECMQRLWDSIPDEKYDFTKYGHWAGTGIVIINDNIKFDFV